MPEQNGSRPLDNRALFSRRLGSQFYGPPHLGGRRQEWGRHPFYSRRWGRRFDDMPPPWSGYWKKHRPWWGRGWGRGFGGRGFMPPYGRFGMGMRRDTDRYANFLREAGAARNAPRAGVEDGLRRPYDALARHLGYLSMGRDGRRDGGDRWGRR